jgi:hypothetical protein
MYWRKLLWYHYQRRCFKGVDQKYAANLATPSRIGATVSLKIGVIEKRSRSTRPRMMKGPILEYNLQIRSSGNTK